MSVEIGQIYPYFFEKDKSRALFNAKVWIGEPDTDPEFNRKVVVGVQENGTEVALNQPLVTNSGGGFSYNGSPVLVRVDPPYSMKVMNSKGQQEYYWPSINPTGGAPTIGATITETQTLTDGQTTVELANQLNGYISVRVNGDFVDDSVLVIDVDYTVTSSYEIELAESYADGTLITIVQNDLSGDSNGSVYCFSTTEAAEAATLPLGSCFTVSETGACYLVVDTDYVKLPGDLTIANGLDAQLKSDSNGDFGVLWFGAAPDPTDATEQSTFFADAAERVGNTGFVIVPNGRFKVSTATPTATQWRLAPNAEIIGLGGVSPTFDTDTTNLTGVMIREYRQGKSSVIYAGETDYSLQKKRGRGVSSALCGVSATGNGGVIGASQSSKSNIANQSCIGVTAVGLNDNESTSRTVWALYSEAVKYDGAGGNTFAHENAIVNKGVVNQTHPNAQPGYGAGITAGEWCSVGIGEEDDTNVSCWKATLSASATAKYSKGWMVYSGAIEVGANYAEAISWPTNYAIVWYPTKGLTNPNQPIAWVKAFDSGTGVGTLRLRVQDVADSTGAEWSLTTTHLSPITNNAQDAGTDSTRIKTIYLQNSPDVVSDEDKKTGKRELTDNELAAGLELSRNIKMFKWVDEVAQKDGDSAYYHTSVMAQKAWQILIDNELDPTDYGFISNSEYGWSIMQSELTMLMCAAIVKNQDDITDRLTALEAK